MNEAHIHRFNLNIREEIGEKNKSCKASLQARHGNGRSQLVQVATTTSTTGYEYEYKTQDASPLAACSRLR
eukprot:scaffold582673_cov38-Prasinocladus_malaysianus.AAC.1